MNIENLLCAIAVLLFASSGSFLSTLFCLLGGKWLPRFPYLGAVIGAYISGIPIVVIALLLSPWITFKHGYVWWVVDLFCILIGMFIGMGTIAYVDYYMCSRSSQPRISIFKS